LSSVRLDSGGLQVDGRYTPLIAGEFEYWRHNPEHWRPILREVKALGCHQVATFICWDFHETSPHNFVFTDPGNHMRSLTKFLDAVAAEGLQAIVRPGPIIDSEWPTRGPAPDVAALERTHPVFRKRAREWIEAVSRALVPYQITKGGPIVLVQLDNEVFYPHCTEASATAADSSFHIPYDESLVMQDLATWSRRTGDAAARLPHGTLPLNRLDPDSQVAAFRFISDQVCDYLSWVQSSMVEAGLELPFYSNVKQFCAYTDFASLSQRLTGGVGGNSYMDLLRDESEMNVAAWWNGVQRATTPFHWAPELWCGRWLEWGQDTSVFDPDHYRFCMLAQCAMGLRGMNYFVLVERDDWHYSPISAIGKIREAAALAVRDVNSVVAQLGADRRLATVALPWSLPQHQVNLADRGFDWTQLSSIWTEQGTAKEGRAWWSAFTALTRADVDFDIVSVDDLRLADYPFVVVPTGLAGPTGCRGRLISAGPDELVDELERAGGVSAIQSSVPGIYTSLYHGAGGGEVVGFCINPADRIVTTGVSFDVEGMPQLDWILEPLAWEPAKAAMTLKPRSVVAFRLNSSLRSRQLWRQD
jgi:hypothetical protein